MSKSHKSSFCSILHKQQLFLNKISPITPAQSNFFNNYDTGKHQVLLGSPGTGKSFLSLYKALDEIVENKGYKKLIIIRSAVQTRDIGFLPGDLKDKSSPYQSPYQNILSELLSRKDAFELLMENEVLSFSLTSFLRGDTLDNSIILLDEVQNLTAHEADSVLTRVGKNSKIIIAGDLKQTDFCKENDKNVINFLEILKQMPSMFDINEFSQEDIVRSGLVKEYIKMKEKFHDNKKYLF